MSDSFFEAVNTLGPAINTFGPFLLIILSFKFFGWLILRDIKKESRRVSMESPFDQLERMRKMQESDAVKVHKALTKTVVYGQGVDVEVSALCGVGQARVTDSWAEVNCGYCKEREAKP